MKNFLFLMLMLPMPVMSIALPWVGLVIWGWFTLMQPHRMLFGVFAEQPYNQVIAIAVLLGLLFGKGDRKIHFGSINWLMAAMIVLLFVSAQYSLVPSISGSKWQELAKSLIYAMLISCFLINRFRCEMMLLTVVFAYGFFGAQGGILFIASGGAHEFAGPERTFLFDRNNLALAITMILPLLNYFRENFVDNRMRLICVVTMFLSVLAVVATGSRGGFLALAVTGVLLLYRSRQKLISAALVAAASIGLVLLAPAEWWDRIETIQTAMTEDPSFQLRLLSWQAHWLVALERPFTGAGVYALNDARTFLHYAPYEAVVDVVNQKGRAAHSIYFQVLGDLGFIALAVYLLMILITFVQLRWLIKHCRQPHNLWMSDMARMVQVSLIAFLIGGAALSLAFFDLFLILLVIVSCLRAIAKDAPNTATRMRTA